jgi:hypothetical protein
MSKEGQAMEFVVGLFFFLLGLSAIAGTFKKPKNDDEAKKLEMFKKHKWKYRIGGYFLMSIGFVLMFPDALQSSNTSQPTIETSTQQQQTQTPDISKENLRQTIISFYNVKYPEAKIGGGDDNYYVRIEFPSKKFPSLTDFVGEINWSLGGRYFFVNCDLGFNNDRNLGNKECLSNEDKEGRSIIDALYYLYKIEKPNMEEFINFIRHNCIESECEIENVPVIASGNKKYMLNITSRYISPNNKHIQYVKIEVMSSK